VFFFFFFFFFFIIIIIIIIKVWMTIKHIVFCDSVNSNFA